MAREYLYRLTFTADYFTLNTINKGKNEEEAAKNAASFMLDHYGMDLGSFGAYLEEGDSEKIEEVKS